MIGVVVILAIISGLGTIMMRSGGISQTLKMFKGNGPSYSGEVIVSPMGTSPQILPEPNEVKMMPPVYGDSGGVASNIVSRQYQRYATFGVVVKDVNAYAANMRTYLTGLGGFITNSSMGQSNDYSYAFVNARVPEDKLDTAMLKVTENVSKVMNQNLSSTDVTAYQQDTKAQITALKKQISQQQLYLSKATSDYEKQRIMLEIESLQNQVASYERQLDVSKEQVQYASLDITAASSTKYFNGQPVGVWEEVKYNFSSFGRIFSSAFKLAVWIGAYALVWLPILVVIRWVFGRK